MLRPKNFSDFIGQCNILKRLSISIQAAKTRDEALGHLILNGPPGLGKTSIAQIIANELDVPIQIGNGANLRSIKSILPYLMRITRKSILFIDEVHRCSNIVQEYIYPTLEDFRIDIGDDNKISIEIPQFTMIVATTESGKLTKPFLDRFPIKCNLELYNDSELSQIIFQSANTLKINIVEDAVIAIAKTSRGTPRIANGRLAWVRDYAIAHDHSTITPEIVLKALAMDGISPNGMDVNDRKYLDVLTKYKMLGLKSLASHTNLSEDTIAHTVEPFLMRLGKIRKTSRGRILYGS